MKHAFEVHGTGESERQMLAAQVAALVSQLHPTAALERRRDERIAIPVLFSLTPLGERMSPLEEEVVTVVGKNISRRGICFFHERPIAHRRACLKLIQPGLGPLNVEIVISWCRFTRPGWYESGGRLVHAIPPFGGRPTSRVLNLEGCSVDDGRAIFASRTAS